MSVYDLPAVNALLNSTSAVLLVLGYGFIRRRRIEAHRACMVSAFLVSVLFLVSYLVYHYYAGSVRFPGTGTVRGLYFAILISHTILAALVPPLALVTLYRAWHGQFQQHRRIARWTFPIWLYVSVTGVVIYLMLYQLYGARPVIPDQLPLA
jgi:putative membrane protein